MVRFFNLSGFNGTSLTGEPIHAGSRRVEALGACRSSTTIDGGAPFRVSGQ
jgi:hypothetical protein